MHLFKLQDVETLKKDLQEIHEAEKSRQERELKAARDRQQAIDDLDRGVSSKGIIWVRTQR